VNNDRRAPLRETGIFTHIYKAFALTGEWLIKPIFNLKPPAVAMHVRDIPYVKSRADKKQRLDVIVPLGTGPFPLLVYVHGGGFVTMDKGHYTRIAKSLASAGYLVLNVNYRRAPTFRFPANLHDVGCAVSWGLANARAYRGDPSRVFMAGDSAGAHLVSTYASALHDPELVREFRLQGVGLPDRIRGLLLFYGVYDCETVLDTGFPFVRMMLEAFLSRDPSLFRKRARCASPVRHITPQYPPCFITWAEKDKLASESEAFGRALDARGVEHEMLTFPPSDCMVIPHGFMNLFWRKSARRAMEAAKSFLSTH
jgi:acetyl esterase